MTHSNEVIRALRDLGVEVDPVTTDRLLARTAAEQRPPACRWRVVSAPRSLKAVLPLLRSGRTSAHAREPRLVRGADLIYQRHARFSLCGALLAQLRGLPLFLEYNSPPISSIPTATYWSVPRRVRTSHAMRAKIVVVSDAAARSLVARGVEPHASSSTRTASIHAHSQRAVAPRRAAAGSSSRRLPDRVRRHVTRVPRNARLIDAFISVSRVLPTARLLLIGEGEERTRAERSWRRGLGDARLHGSVAPDEVRATSTRATCSSRRT